MNTIMLINAAHPEEYRIAFIKGGMLDGFQVETSTAEQKVGNIYKGMVEKVEPRLQACFVNYGVDKNGFLSITDVHPEYYKVDIPPSGSHRPPPIEKVLHKGQEVLIQVTREMPGRKGAQLTTFISLAGRFVVITPGRVINGVSRKIESEAERHRLKEVMGQIKLPEEIGYIVRTVAAGQSKKDLSKDITHLVRMWKSIRARVKEAPSLSLIHKEQDVGLRTLRDSYTGDVSEILVDEKETFAKIVEYMKIISPKDQEKVKLYRGRKPIFDQYEIEDQIESIYRNKVFLRSGGSIVINQTEALIAIDVNSGRGKAGDEPETMILKTNLDASREIARQLRLRDMGGLIVIDFIDMWDRNHIRQVEKVFRDELKTDRAKIDTAHISKFGLMELSRERLRPSIESKSYMLCHYCSGRGMIMSVESAAISYLRRIWMGLSKGDVVQVTGTLSPEVASYLLNRKRRELSEMEKRYGVAISLTGDRDVPPGEGRLDFLRDEGSKKEPQGDTPE
ncbi:MAG: ribonuclease [Deltaproteobacteria bacterium HGW-Deltaproteobacteria-15]|jgi:ribonuclease E|nr:MAG: ribonuclease [Deltaproteobacteria bacterium HGW-Deltaproteobacteria-15]